MADTPITPTVPTTPIAGQSPGDLNQSNATAARKRKTVMELRKEALQRIAASKNPIFKRVYHKTIQAGALTTFNYSNWKHDPYPLVLCSSVYSDGKVAGINLHYLTFKYIKYLIEQYCGKAFSYPLIKNNTYIKNAFRTYRRDGIRMSKLLDCEFLMTLLGTVRSFSPNEIEAIREEVQRQLRAKINPSAEELESSTTEYASTIVPNPHDPRYNKVAGYDPLERFGEPLWPRAEPALRGPKPTLDKGTRLPKDLEPPPG